MQEIDTNKNIYYNEEGGGFDVGRFAQNLLNKIWAILLVGAIFAAAGLAIAKATYVEVYSSNMTLSFMQTKMVIIKDYSGRKDAPVEYEEEKSFYGASDARTYQYLLKSDEMVKMIQDKLKEVDPNKDYSHSFIENSLGITSIEEGISGFFRISVTSTDKAYCERALEVVLEEFPEFVQGFDNTLSVKVIKSAKAPVVTNSDGASTKAHYGFIIGANLCIGCTKLLGSLFRTGQHQIAEINHLCKISAIFECGHMFAVGNPAAPDDTDTEFLIFHVISPF